jgi:hypothetical protein
MADRTEIKMRSTRKGVLRVAVYGTSFKNTCPGAAYTGRNGYFIVQPSNISYCRHIGCWAPVRDVNTGPQQVTRILKEFILWDVTVLAGCFMLVSYLAKGNLGLRNDGCLSPDYTE